MPSLVQYPLPGSFKPLEKSDKQQNGEASNQNKIEDQSESLVQNERSEVLAMALGVQIKTGEDPPTGEIKISGYDKKGQRNEEKSFKNNADGNERLQRREQELNSRLMEIAGQAQKQATVVRAELAHQNSRSEKENRDENKRSERNKFEIEKPDSRPTYERTYSAPVSVLNNCWFD